MNESDWNVLIDSDDGRSKLLVSNKIPLDLFNEVKKEANSLELTHRPSLGMIYGRECFSPRDIGFYSNETKEYAYSNSARPALPIPPSMKKLLDWINDNVCNNGQKFNGVLVNLYPDGRSTIGKHSDQERELVPGVGVLALSIGVTRKFRVRDKKTGKIVMDVPTKDGELMWMYGDFQKKYTHEIPSELKINKYRISYTFRYHK